LTGFACHFLVSLNAEIPAAEPCDISLFMHTSQNNGADQASWLDITEAVQYSTPLYVH
jgi:hypothetical protein